MKSSVFYKLTTHKEFIGGEFNNILEKEAASSNLSPSHIPELNGVAERYKKTFANKIFKISYDLLRTTRINVGIYKNLIDILSVKIFSFFKASATFLKR